ncbi:Hypp4102 [Branchiostoma lanceolatum]|uniref:Hypp4102 protein n=1 Tax=Branchiostoma lanceolatum TaxID=7740 RepID=A0A8K0EUC6_BRALA|nr:Hypp4102 [Branchiostoma lanceolatum]
MTTTARPYNMLLTKITIAANVLLLLILHCSAQSTNMTTPNSALVTVTNSTNDLMVNSTQKSTPRFIKINTSIDNWAKAGIAIGLTLGVVLIAGIVAVSCHCWLRNQKGSVLVPDIEEDAEEAEEEVHLAA